MKQKQAIPSIIVPHNFTLLRETKLNTLPSLQGQNYKSCTFQNYPFVGESLL